MEEIRLLIDELRQTESERNKVLKELENVIGEAVDEMLDLLFSLFDSLKKKGLSVRSYKGSLYPVQDGIIVYNRGLEEKVILNEEKKLIHYSLQNEKLIENEIPPEFLINQIGSEKIYHNLQDLLKERIRTNKEDIINFRNQTGKISRYAREI